MKEIPVGGEKDGLLLLGHSEDVRIIRPFIFSAPDVQYRVAMCNEQCFGGLREVLVEYEDHVEQAS